MSDNQLTPGPEAENGPAAQQDASAAVEPDPAVAIARAYAVMQRETQSWGRWLLGFGVLHLIASDLLSVSAPWGVLLLIVGAGSFYFREAPMFVIYGVTLAWAALSNVIAGEIGWILFGLFQAYLAFRVFRQFGQFRRVESGYAALQDASIVQGQPVAQRAARTFPWISGLLGIVSVIGFIALFVSAIVLAAVDSGIPNAFDFLLGLSLQLGVLGVAVGLSSLLSGHRHKLAAAIGLAASSLTVLTNIGLILLP